MVQYVNKNSLVFWGLLLFLFGLAPRVKAQQQVEIYQIQGSGSISPFINQRVITTGIVTAVADDRFFMQTPDAGSDNDIQTSDGIMVFTGNRASFSSGDLVEVSGRIVEFEGTTEFSNTDLNARVLQSGLPLPSPTILDANFPGTLNTSPQRLERVEGMFIRIDNAIFTRPSDSRGRATINAGGTRTFREPGIFFPGQNGLPVWDGNPELITFDPDFILNQRPTFSAGNRMRTEGVLFEEDGRFRLVSTSYEFDGGPVLEEVRDREDREVMVGSINTLVFSKNEPFFDARKQKLARYVVELMKSPEILAVQEVQSLAVLEELRDEIQRIAPQSQYSAHLIPGSSGGSFSIQTGFLVSDDLQNIVITQLAANQFLSIGGRLHDRPPLLLEAEFKTPEPTPIAVLNLHLRSLNGIEGGDAFFVRTKRHEQAISVAQIIQSLQGTNLVVTGDFNAYAFSDGYVDVMSQISGQPSLGAAFTPEDIVSPPLTIQTTQMPPEEQYSFIFQGNSQVLDHFLTTEMQRITINEMQYARGNSDNPESYLYNSDVLFRSSDHDGLVLFLELEDPLDINVSTQTPSTTIDIRIPTPFQPDRHRVQLRLPQEEVLTLQLYRLDGQLVYEQPAQRISMGRSDWPLPTQLSEGLYVLRVFGDRLEEVRKIIIANN